MMLSRPACLAVGLSIDARFELHIPDCLGLNFRCISPSRSPHSLPPTCLQSHRFYYHGEWRVAGPPSPHALSPIPRAAAKSGSVRGPSLPHLIFSIACSLYWLSAFRHMSRQRNTALSYVSQFLHQYRICSLLHTVLYISDRVEVG